jgi:hypothetical protein
MCAFEGDCGAQAACVAGRCVVHGAVPAIATARRLLFAPTDVGYVHKGFADAQEGVPSIVPLGRDDAGLAFLQFAIPLTPEVNVLEAYLLLERPPGLGADPAPVLLHAARIHDAWDSRSLSWARQPRIEEIGAPVTQVLPNAGPLVRVDVRLLVERWRRRAADEYGIAIVATGGSVSGIPVALAPGSGGRGPMLELYVK